MLHVLTDTVRATSSWQCLQLVIGLAFRYEVTRSNSAGDKAAQTAAGFASSAVEHCAMPVGCPIKRTGQRCINNNNQACMFYSAVETHPCTCLGCRRLPIPRSNPELEITQSVLPHDLAFNRFVGPSVPHQQGRRSFEVWRVTFLRHHRVHDIC